MMVYPADEPASDETFRRAGEIIFQSKRSPPETNTGYQWPRSNNGVRSCGRPSSTQSTAKFSGPPCLECTSWQPPDRHPAPFPGLGCCRVPEKLRAVTKPSDKAAAIVA